MYSKVLRDILTEVNEEEFVLSQVCSVQGLVQRTAEDAMLCDDPHCASCREVEYRLLKAYHAK